MKFSELIKIRTVKYYIQKGMCAILYHERKNIIQQNKAQLRFNSVFHEGKDLCSPHIGTVQEFYKQLLNHKRDCKLIERKLQKRKRKRKKRATTTWTGTTKQTDPEARCPGF